MQINNIKDEKGNIPKNSNEIQRIIKECFKNLYTNKLESLEEMDKFLNAYEQPQLSQEDTNS
jgi:hypothetical protein